MGVGGKAIPPNTDPDHDIQSDARFLFLVEKDAAFMRLAEDRFYNKYPCIILTAKGQPDVATRMFLVREEDRVFVAWLCAHVVLEFDVTTHKELSRLILLG